MCRRTTGPVGPAHGGDRDAHWPPDRRSPGELWSSAARGADARVSATRSQAGSESGQPAPPGPTISTRRRGPVAERGPSAPGEVGVGCGTAQMSESSHPTRTERHACLRPLPPTPPVGQPAPSPPATVVRSAVRRRTRCRRRLWSRHAGAEGNHKGRGRVGCPFACREGCPCRRNRPRRQGCPKLRQVWNGKHRGMAHWRRLR